MPKKVVKTPTPNGKKAKNGKARTKKPRDEKENEVMLKSIRKVGSQDLMNNHHHGGSRDKHLEAEEDHDVITMPPLLPKRRTNRCLCVIISGLLILIFSGAVVILVLLFLMVGERPPKVQTDCGYIEGDFDSATKSFIFKGIPYAKPPENVLRWHPPEPLQNESCWEGVYIADKTHEQCAQKDPKTNQISGSEDCLYLNVFTPAIDPLKLAPVMVFLHGGYLQWGNASTRGYSPDEHTSVDLGVVFVNVQYRLGAFGYMVTKAQVGTGNYGLLDQIEALTWVKKNIRKFGGDPDKITVFGHGAGATSVFALMTSPKAKGLFQRAWMMSGSPLLEKTLDEAREQNDFFLRKLNCSDEACLLRKSTSEILDATYPQWDFLDSSMDLPTKGVFEDALLIVDGIVLPKAPLDTWRDKDLENYSDVPLVIGTTAQEIDLCPAPGNDIKKWNYEDLYKDVSTHLDAFSNGLSNRSLELYGDAEKDPEYIFTTMATDIRITCGNNRLGTIAADAMTSYVYRYVVTSTPSRNAHAFGIDFDAKYAFRGWDIYAFLDTYGTIMSGKSDADNRFSRTLQDNMLNFAKNGEPKDKSWTPYPLKVALIDEYIRVNNTYNAQQCALWGNEWFAYSSVN